MFSEQPFLIQTVIVFAPAIILALVYAYVVVTCSYPPRPWSWPFKSKCKGVSGE